MKTIIENLASRSKKMQFKFDEDLDLTALIELLLGRLFQLLRGCLLLFRGKRPKVVFVGKGVTFRSVNKVDIGRWAYIGNYCFISGLGVGRLSIGAGVTIGSHSRIFISSNYRNLGSYVRIEDNVGIGDYSCIAGSGGITIGSGTITGPYFSAHPENHNFKDVSSEIRSQGTTRKEIQIGSGCWIGAKVTVLAGVTIGEGCVVGAGSVVTKDIPDNCIVVGVPARIVRSRG